MLSGNLAKGGGPYIKGEGLQHDLWAMVEGTEAVLEKTSFKGRGQNLGVQRW